MRQEGRSLPVLNRWKRSAAVALGAALFGAPGVAHAQGVTNPADHPAPITVMVDGQTYHDGLDTLPGYDDQACTPIPNVQYDFASDQIQYYSSDGDLIDTAHWTEWSRISSYATWQQQQQTGTPTSTPTPTATASNPAASTPTPSSNAPTSPSASSPAASSPSANSPASTSPSTKRSSTKPSSTKTSTPTGSSPTKSSSTQSSTTNSASSGSTTTGTSNESTSSSSSPRSGTSSSATNDAAAAAPAGDAAVAGTAATAAPGASNAPVAGGGGPAGGAQAGTATSNSAQDAPKYKLASEHVGAGGTVPDTRLAGVVILMAVFGVAGVGLMARGIARRQGFGRW
jgi:hypothetical protein